MGFAHGAPLVEMISDYRREGIDNHFKQSSFAMSEAIIKVKDLLWKNKSFEKALTLVRENLINGKKGKASNLGRLVLIS